MSRRQIVKLPWAFACAAITLILHLVVIILTCFSGVTFAWANPNEVRFGIAISRGDILLVRRQSIRDPAAHTTAFPRVAWMNPAALSPALETPVELWADPISARISGMEDYVAQQRRVEAVGIGIVKEETSKVVMTTISRPAFPAATQRHAS